MEWIDRIYEIEIEGNRGLDRLYFYERRRKQHQHGIILFPIYQLRRGEFGLHHHLGDHLRHFFFFFFLQHGFGEDFDSCVFIFIWLFFSFLFCMHCLERFFSCLSLAYWNGVLALAGFLLASFLHRGFGQNLGG
jgi:hypothetical protein